MAESVHILHANPDGYDDDGSELLEAEPWELDESDRMADIMDRCLKNGGGTYQVHALHLTFLDHSIEKSFRSTLARQEGEAPHISGAVRAGVRKAEARTRGERQHRG